ncbi:hypothetical protein DV738_g3618, partial [Chaetothyriales sp. CBS 135597]
MEGVFISVHDLSQDARIKFCSDSIHDILGYSPSEVKGKSCWEYFHPDEIAFAKSVHNKGLNLDKAAVLNYCQIRHKNGDWIGCECVFTIVYDVLVASISVYRRGPKARRRAVEGAMVRRIFSSTSKDPRYRMLSFLSNKFYQPPTAHCREPRAALFLNRFTRSSTIMFATSSVSTILGLGPEQLMGKSFYYCITENCLADAVKCVESAKSNDSIAYLRFWYRDPTIPDAQQSLAQIDVPEDDGGGNNTYLDRGSLDITNPRHGSSEKSKDGTEQDKRRVFDIPVSGRTTSPATKSSKPMAVASDTHIEIEAVVSCSSDSLVVVIRRAHPLVPISLKDTGNAKDEVVRSQEQQSPQPKREREPSRFCSGLFASPWAPKPVLPENVNQTTPRTGGVAEVETPTHIRTPLTSRPDSVDSAFMSAIHDVAVFTWPLVGINGRLAEAQLEAMPPDLQAAWGPNASVSETDDERYHGFRASRHRAQENADKLACCSDEENMWKSAPETTTWRLPKRDWAHPDAFGDESDGRRKRASTKSGGVGAGYLSSQSQSQSQNRAT